MGIIRATPLPLLPFRNPLFGEGGWGFFFRFLGTTEHFWSLQKYIILMIMMMMVAVVNMMAMMMMMMKIITLARRSMQKPEQHWKSSDVPLARPVSFAPLQYLDYLLPWNI